MIGPKHSELQQKCKIYLDKQYWGLWVKIQCCLLLEKYIINVHLLSPPVAWCDIIINHTQNNSFHAVCAIIVVHRSKNRKAANSWRGGCVCTCIFWLLSMFGINNRWQLRLVAAVCQGTVIHLQEQLQHQQQWIGGSIEILETLGVSKATKCTNVYCQLWAMVYVY